MSADKKSTERSREEQEMKEHGATADADRSTQDKAKSGVVGQIEKESGVKVEIPSETTPLLKDKPSPNGTTGSEIKLEKIKASISKLPSEESNDKDSGLSGGSLQSKTEGLSDISSNESSRKEASKKSQSTESLSKIGKKGKEKTTSSTDAPSDGGRSAELSKRTEASGSLPQDEAGSLMPPKVQATARAKDDTGRGKDSADSSEASSRNVAATSAQRPQKSTLPVAPLSTLSLPSPPVPVEVKRRSENPQPENRPLLERPDPVTSRDRVRQQISITAVVLLTISCLTCLILLICWVYGYVMGENVVYYLSFFMALFLIAALYFMFLAMKRGRRMRNAARS